ncbi:SGNH/GDSL hydrolase family protein [Bradyrhizobium sp. Ash2021]|uniref:SGNH/GDSL hydrolase family protein n=1 Tax=Bradyrhizobium sp. Ash2021 TaxID=2954771 RepID=UPI0028164922|nr:SGNH/GDSL hydrolase family protein [Bradyrhizobium sp. Ash2021]WMT72535.1 SGNH/GDSL hydrolase family protein [Bradyrhizobium sp. Ash2021]
MIKAALAGLDRPAVFLGDSITEMARLPETICGKPIVNAGIGGVGVADFEYLAPRLMDGSTPSLIIVALGANDVGSTTAQRDYADLLSELKKLSSKLLVVAVTPLDGADQVNAQIKAAAQSEGVPFVESLLPAGSTFDGIHLTAAGYKVWTPAILRAATKALGCQAD